MKKRNVIIFIVCLLISYFVAFIGSLFIMQGIKSDWYLSVKPLITPPDWIFGVVWNFIFFLIAMSLFFAWTSAKSEKDRKRIFQVYSINFVANAFWSIFYFTLHQPLWAFIDLVVVGISILSIMLATWDDDRRVTLLLTPYFIWICFAGVLNWMSIA